MRLLLSALSSDFKPSNFRHVIILSYTAAISSFHWVFQILWYFKITKLKVAM